MTRGIWTKWIIGAAFLLLIVAVGCYWYYQHTTAQYKAEAEQTDKLLKQWKADEAKPTITAETESTQAPAESTENTAEKPTNIIGEETETNTDKATEPVDIATQEQENTEEVKVSPHGFGEYPEIPEDFPGKENIEWGKDSAGIEIINRVLIKLWTEGERNFRGGGTHRGKVYPWYHDTIYVKFRYAKNADGEIIGRSSDKMSGPLVDWSAVKDWSNPPPHIRILDLETSGIDPYQYLNLPKKRSK